MEQMERKQKHFLDKRITIFLALTFALTWGLLFVPLAMGVAYGSPVNGLILSICMLIPALSSILTRLITKEGFSNMMLRPRFKPKGNRGAYAIAWFLPAGLILAGAALFFLAIPGAFDPELSQLRALIAGSGLSVTAVLMIQFVQALLLSPIVNIVFTLGEELGWRGYLLPKLLKETSPKNAILASGAIWGLWHAPMIAMGHNFGTDYVGYPYLGVLLMTVFCVFFGAVLSYVTMKTKSAIPAAVGHGALNGMAAISMLALSAAGQSMRLFGPYAMGLISVIPTVIVGLIFLKKAAALSLEPDEPAEPKAEAPAEQPEA